MCLLLTMIWEFLVGCGADEIGVACSVIHVVWYCKKTNEEDECVAMIIFSCLVSTHICNDLAVCAVELHDLCSSPT